MEKSTHFPDPNRLSMLTGVILLAYAISQYLAIPVNQIAIQLPGIFIPLNFEFRHLVTITVALLAATGMDWIISDHPNKVAGDRMQHWMLPALTAWVIGIPLYSIDAGLTWWGVFISGGILLILVIVAEYITVDPGDTRNTLVGIGLSALSLVLFLILAISIRATGIRLYLILPAVGIGSGLVALRILYLRSGNIWQYSWGLGISMFIVQIAAGLHYLPVSSVQFGLILIGFLYGLISISESVLQGTFTKTALLEPGIVLCVVLILALIIG